MEWIPKQITQKYSEVQGISQDDNSQVIILDQASLEGMAGAAESPPPSLPQIQPATQKSS